MISYAGSCYPMAVQSVRDAISKDGRGATKEAYCNYLSCILFMVQALKDDAWDKQEMKELCHDETFKLFKMTEQCLGRAHDILKSLKQSATDQENLKDNSDGNSGNGSKRSPTPLPRPNTRPSNLSKTPAERRHSQPPAPTPRSPTTHKVTRSASNVTGTPKSLQSYSHVIAALPIPPGCASPSTSPKGFQVQNQAMFQAYQQRKTLRGNIHQKFAAVNFNLGLFRKEAEKMALSRAREKAAYEKFMKKQSQMKLEAERRWNQREHHSSRDKAYRQTLLISILAFEEDAGWARSFRDTLVLNCDIAVIMNVVQAVLASKNHPLSMVLNELQTDAYLRIKTLLDESQQENNNKRDDYLEPIDSLNRRENNIIPTSIGNSDQENGNDKIFHFKELDKTTGVNPHSPAKSASDNPYIQNNTDNPYIQNNKKNTDGYTKVATDDSNRMDENDIDIKETYRSSQSISLERAFEELEDDMFSSSGSEEEEEEGEKLKNDDNSEINSEYTHKPLTSTSSDVSNKVSDVVNGNNYEILIPGWDTLKLNKELIKDMAKNNTNNVDEAEESNINNQDEIQSDPLDNQEPSNANGQPKAGSDASKKPSSINIIDSDGYMQLQEFKEDMYMELISSENENNDEDDNNIVTKIDDSNYQSLDLGEVKTSVDNDYEELGNKIPSKDKVNSETMSLDIYEEITPQDTDNNLSPEIESRERFHSKKTYRRFSEECLKMIDTQYLKGVDTIVQDLRFGIDRIHSVLLLTYEGLDTPTGRDQSYATLEDIFFQSLWPWLIRMFRQLNIHKEEAMLKVMQKYSSCQPKDMKIREKYSLIDKDILTPQQPFKPAIDEMKLLRTYKCPLEKLECTVRVSKAICHCVESFWLKKGETSPPSVGCDDLLPILSYVILKSRSPQIVSECHAMEEFIHEGYLMGEEGYCLTTLHAAISYLLSLGKDL